MRKSLKSDVLNYLKNHKKEGISFIECWNCFNKICLREAIRDLRKEGYNIISKPILKDGKPTNACRYFLMEE
jgi:hypothetical protein